MPPILDDPFPLGDDELSKKLAARRAALEQSYNTNALEAEATPELSGTQIGASAAIKLLPLLLGMAIARRRNVGAALGADAGLKYSGEYEKGELADQESKIKQSGLRANQAFKELSTINDQAYGIAKQKDAQRYQDRSREDTQTFQSEQNAETQKKIDSRFYEGQKRADERARIRKPTALESALGPEGAKDYYKTQQETNAARKRRLESVSQNINDRQLAAREALHVYSDLARSRAGTDPNVVNAFSKGFSEVINSVDKQGQFDPERIFSDIAARNKLDPNSPSGQFFKKTLIAGRATAIAQRGTATNQDVENEISNVMPAYLEKDGVYLRRLKWMADSNLRKGTDALNSEIDQGRLEGKNLLKTLNDAYASSGFSNSQKPRPVSNLDAEINGQKVKAQRYSDGKIYDMAGNLLGE